MKYPFDVPRQPTEHFDLDKTRDGLAEMMRRFVSPSRIAYALTLQFNKVVLTSAAHLSISRLSSRIDRKTIGRSHKRDSKSNERIRGILLPEISRSRETNHYHGIVSVSSIHQIMFDYLVEPTWKEIQPAGTAKAEQIYDLEGWIRYVLKQCDKNTAQNYTIIT